MPRPFQHRRLAASRTTEQAQPRQLSKRAELTRRLPDLDHFIVGERATLLSAPDPLRALGPAYVLLENKYFLDDLYLRGIVRPIQYKLSAAVDWFNTHVIDGIVNGAPQAARGLAWFVDLFDRRAIDGAVNGVAESASFSGGLLRYIQSGNVQRYAVFLFAGVAILVFVFTRV